jgi:conjugal transfer mating pair stabilization protein TraN
MKGSVKGFLTLLTLMVPCLKGDLVVADEATHYQEGKSFAQEVQPTSPTQGDASRVPGYAGDNPAQTAYYQNSHLLANDATNLTLQSSEAAEASGDHRAMAGSFVRESENTRTRFDLRGDPLITDADQVIEDPLKVLQATKTNLPQGEVIEESTHTCEESREEEELGCIERRIIRIKEPEPQIWTLQVGIYNHGQGSQLGVDVITGRQLDGVHSEYGGGHSTGRRVVNPMPVQLHDRIVEVSKSLKVVRTGGSEDQHRYVKLDGRQLWINPYGYTGSSLGWAWVYATVYIDVTYIPLATEADLVEGIDGGCRALEARADRGECRYSTIEILEGPEEREISNGRDTIKVYRKWWKRRLTYTCRYPSQNDCEQYRAKGCEQVNSQCKTKVGERCLEYRQTFRCQKRRLNNGAVTIAGDGVPFCLDGNCDDHSWAPNQDFAEAMAKLSVFKEMGKDMNGDNATVFKGEGRQCSKKIAGFKDCCKHKGWGRKVGLAQGCTDEDKDLSKKRAANLCVYVGTYCAKRAKPSKICKVKKSSFCCFGTKLARIIHEQGRPQLGIGFGSAKHPDCRSLRVDELQRLDFSKINFAELYAEVQAKAPPQLMANTIAGTATRLGQDWGAKVSAPTFNIEAEKAKRLKKIHDQKQNTGEQSDGVM